MGMDYSLVQRIIDGLGKILDTKPGSPDEGTYVTEQQLADWIKGQTVVPAYYYNGVMYSDALHTTPITGQAGALYIDQDNNVLYRWDGAAWDAMSDNQLRQDILDGTVVAKKAECDEDGNNIKATYATKVEAANLQSQVDAIDHRVQNLEQAKGSYVVQNYKDGSITPSGKGAWSIVEGLRGVSRVDNNGVQNGTFDSTDNWNISSSGATWSVSGNVATISYDTAYRGISQPISFLKGHKYLVRVDLKKVDADAGVQVVISDNSNFTLSVSTDNVGTNWTSCEAIVSTDTNVGSSVAIFIRNGSSGYASAKSVQARNVVLTDLNIYFGTSDLSFLGATDSAKLATIQKDYPHLLLPSEYGTRIVDSSYSGVRAWARNIWDEEWDNGTIDSSGNNASGSTVRSKNYIPVVPSETYYFLTPIEKVIAIAEYDADKNFIKFVYANGDSKTVENNCFYIRFYVLGTGYTSYANDICINQSDSQNGTYTPYHAPDTLSLSFTGKSAGSVAEMYYPETGEQTKPTGTRTYSANEVGEDTSAYTNVKYFYVNKPSNSRGINTSEGYGFTTKYLVYPYYSGAGASGWDDAKCIGNCFTGFIYSRLYFGFAPNTTLEQAKAQIDGLVFQYELKEADPSTFVTPIIDNTLLTEAGGRMSTVQTGTVVDGSFDMGFINL